MSSCICYENWCNNIRKCLRRKLSLAVDTNLTTRAPMLVKHFRIIRLHQIACHCLSVRCIASSWIWYFSSCAAFVHICIEFQFHVTLRDTDVCRDLFSIHFSCLISVRNGQYGHDMMPTIFTLRQTLRVAIPNSIAYTGRNGYALLQHQRIVTVAR